MTNTIEVPATRPQFSAAEHERRAAAVATIMEENALDALLVYGTAGFMGAVHYLTDYLPRQPTWLVVSADLPPTLLLHFVNHVPNTRAISRVDDIRCYWPSAEDAVTEELARRTGSRGRIGLVGSGAAMPYAQVSAIRARLSDVDFVDVSRQLNQARWIRSEEEILRIRQSGAIIDEACDFLAENLRPGMTELDAKALLHSSFVPRGGDEGIIYLSSTDMAAPERKSPWQFPGFRELSAGDVLISEITINYFGYGGQIHRPFAIGAEPTPLYQELFDVAVECFDTVQAVLRAGTTAEEVREAGMIVEERGFRLFDSLLHGETGRNPELGSSGSDHAFEPWIAKAGQLVILQPNPVTEDGTAGLQAGCALLIEADGATPLHGYPLKFPVCG